MKDETIKINLMSIILLGFAFNPALVVLAQNYIPPTNTQAQQDAVKKLIPYDANKMPDIYKNEYFFSQPIEKGCPIGKTDQVISNYAEINIKDVGVMGVCLAKKTQKEQLQKAIFNATDLGKVSQEVKGYRLAIDIPCSTIAGGQCPKITGPATYIARLYQFGLMIAGLAAFGSIVFGALKYVLSAGSFASTEEAKDQITQAIYGLVLLLGAFLILYTINPRLVSLTNPNVPVLNVDEIINQEQGTGLNNQLNARGGIPEDPLCSRGRYPGISLTVGGTEQINQSFKCSQCVTGASIQNNKCQCDSGNVYSSSDGFCITEEACKNKSNFVEQHGQYVPQNGQCVNQ